MTPDTTGQAMDELANGAGHESPRCGARKHQGTGTCRKPAGWGTDHVGIGCCRLHGGSTRSQVAAARREQVQAQARDAVRGIVIRDVTDPLKALARHAGEIVAVRDFLRGQVERLESLRYQAGAGEQLRAELAAYQAALRDTTQVLGVYARLNIDERLARITQRQSDIVIAALNAGLDAAGIRDGDDRQRARAAIAAVLRKYAADEQQEREPIAGEVVRVNGSRP